MAKTKFKENPEMSKIFSDLEKFKDFCVDYGHVYDEKFLYDMKTFQYQQFQKFLSKKRVKNIWEEELKRMKERT